MTLNMYVVPKSSARFDRQPTRKHVCYEPTGKAPGSDAYSRRFTDMPYRSPQGKHCP